MPRQRDVVMNPSEQTFKKLHDSAIKRAIKLHSPYEVVAGELAGVDKDLYAVVYTAPLGGDRYIAATRARAENARALRDLLSTAWAEGFWASGRE